MRYSWDRHSIPKSQRAPLQTCCPGLWTSAGSCPDGRSPLPRDRERTARRARRRLRASRNTRRPPALPARSVLRAQRSYRHRWTAPYTRAGALLQAPRPWHAKQHTRRRAHPLRRKVLRRRLSHTASSRAAARMPYANRSVEKTTPESCLPGRQTFVNQTRCRRLARFARSQFAVPSRCQWQPRFWARYSREWAGRSGRALFAVEYLRAACVTA